MIDIAIQSEYVDAALRYLEFAGACFVLFYGVYFLDLVGRSRQKPGRRVEK